MPHRILLVDDDPDMLLYLEHVCRLGSLEPHPVSNGKDALRLIRAKPFDLALVDIRLDAVDGKALCPELKAASLKPGLRVVLMTADPDPLQECIALEKSGADDFIQKVCAPGGDGKPIGAMRLLARLRKHLEQAQGSVECLCAGELEVNLRTRQARKGGRLLGGELPAREFQLLCHLLRYPDEILSKQRLLTAVWPGQATDPNIVEQVMHRLRLFLEDPQGEMLRTVRGVGYRLVAATPERTP